LDPGDALDLLSELRVQQLDLLERDKVFRGSPVEVDRQQPVRECFCGECVRLTSEGERPVDRLTVVEDRDRGARSEAGQCIAEDRIPRDAQIREILRGVACDDIANEAPGSHRDRVPVSPGIRLVRMSRQFSVHVGPGHLVLTVGQPPT